MLSNTKLSVITDSRKTEGEATIQSFSQYLSHTTEAADSPAEEANSNTLTQAGSLSLFIQALGPNEHSVTLKPSSLPVFL